MKKILIAGLLTLLISCNDQEDMFEKINNKPLIKISKTEVNLFVSTIYDSVKIGQDYAIKYQISDEQNLQMLIKKNFENDSVITDNNGNVKIINKTEGVCTIDFIVNDCYTQKDTAEIKLFAFKNLAPICSFIVVIPTAKLDPLERLIDASASFDLDKKWGGKIVKYRYKIGSNYIVENTKNKISYIFGSSGVKRISVQVQDNEGIWSSEVSQNIEVIK
jgi:hypothetical protein